MTKIKIVNFDAVKHKHLLPAIRDLHIEAIAFENAVLRFHPPFTEEKRTKMMSFWEERAQQVVSGHRIIFMAIASASGGTESASGEVTSDGTEYLAGVIELGMPEADSGPFRGDVEMLMVSSKHRNQGIGKKLIYELERTALERGRTLLQLATMADTVADAHFYPKLGYVKFGTVPNYGIEPVTMRLVDGAYFYKDLARPST